MSDQPTSANDAIKRIEWDLEIDNSRHLCDTGLRRAAEHVLDQVWEAISSCPSAREIRFALESTELHVSTEDMDRAIDDVADYARDEGFSDGHMYGSDEGQSALLAKFEALAESIDGDVSASVLLEKIWELFA